MPCIYVVYAPFGFGGCRRRNPKGRPRLKVGNAMLRTDVLKAAEDYILEGQYRHKDHAPFATHVAPFLASVDNPHNMVAVIARLSGCGFLLCTDDATAQTTAQLLRIGYEWLEKTAKLSQEHQRIC